MILKEKMLLFEANRWVGVSEVGGNNQGQLVELFQKAAGGHAGDSWCAAFVVYCIKAVDALCIATDLNPNPCQNIAVSESCLYIWSHAPLDARMTEPKEGALIVWQKYNGEIPTMQGHIGIVESVRDDGLLNTIEGNTSPSFGINREGDGVYRKIRPNGGMGDMRLKGFLKVW